MTSRPVVGGGDLSAARKGRLRGYGFQLNGSLGTYALTA